jgi:hypothetical protein
MVTGKGHSRPIKRESRPAGTVRLPKTCQLGCDEFGNSTSALQLQRLNAAFGLTGLRAELIASLHWGALPSYNEGMR